MDCLVDLTKQPPLLGSHLSIRGAGSNPPWTLHSSHRETLALASTILPLSTSNIKEPDFATDHKVSVPKPQSIIFKPSEIESIIQFPLAAFISFSSPKCSML